MTIDEQSLTLLLTGSGRVTLRIDGSNAVTEACNAAQLAAWLKQDAYQPGPDAGLAHVLQALFDVQTSDRIWMQIGELRAMPEPVALPVAVLPGRMERLALRQRWFECSLHPGAAQDAQRPIVLLLNDVSELQELNLALQAARAARDLTLTVLRTDANAMRTLRDAGVSAVATIRAALRLPARTQEALQVKLGRMQHEADALGGRAQVLALGALVQACEELTSVLVSLRQKEELTGDALLPVAPRIDAISAALAELERIDSQRAPPAAMPATSLATVRSLPGSTVPWHESSEARWRTYIHQMGDSVGVLARLKFVGGELVPPRFQRHVDGILHSLLDNALQHGIEDFERRLKAGKAAAGQITVTFRDLGNGGTEMTVHDDGDGFDVERIGRAAVLCGLLEEAALEDLGKAELMGFIFRPKFTTEGLPGNAGRGRGIASVRRTVTRAGGKVAVATKRHRYTLFTIRLPALERASAVIRQKAASAS